MRVILDTNALVSAPARSFGMINLPARVTGFRHKFTIRANRVSHFFQERDPREDRHCDLLPALTSMASFRTFSVLKSIAAVSLRKSVFSNSRMTRRSAASSSACTLGRSIFSDVISDQLHVCI